ncbi:uncharacterized protein LOC114519648 [Dendronephthya gigantea]|uniref:uncharacterized protein LOC114519648 n=1 Tax=Dendronephthya gigantea TaxID=151771 RepID=UPI00106914B6|nr:uncharacterized protein LOC114519648 [Dendronephthya gigantea]
MEFYREGFLNKAGKGLIQTHLHSWRPRYFVLDRWSLKYYKTKELLPENMLGCIEVVEIDSISMLKGEKNAFQITTKPGRTYYMSGRNEDEVQGWIRCLRMAKSKYLEKHKKTSDAVPSIYDEPNFAGPPQKPPRNLDGMDTVLLDPSEPPEFCTRPTTTSNKPVISAYQCIEFPKTDTKTTDKPAPKKLEETNPYADPTYETVNEKAVTKDTKSSDPNADLYDTVTVESRTTSLTKKQASSSDPPPLPARLPSMSGEESVTQSENKSPVASGNVQVSAVGLYEDVGSASSTPATVTAQAENQSSPSKTAAVSSLYDEVGSPESCSPPSQPQGSVCNGVYDEVCHPDKPSTTTNDEIPQNRGDSLYDEAVTPGSPTKPEEKEVESIFVPDPTHVYAKPDKKASSLKRDRSKKKLIPGLMDVGEVDIDAETEAEGGKETLKRGMTMPMGDQFAIEDLRDTIKEFDEEINNNSENGKMLSDFDVNQNESAFELLVRFCERYD